MSGEGVRQRARDEMTDEQVKELLLEYGDRCYASGENILSGNGMVANAERRKELYELLLNLMAESSLARKQEREECAKAVCRHCRDGMKRVINTHQGTYYTFECEAWAIHERGRKVEG